MTYAKVAFGFCMTMQDGKDNVMRVRVVRCAADALVCAGASDAESLRVSYTTGLPDETFDSGYLRGLLRPGMRVNLVDCRRQGDDGLVYARFIVAEPDYLVNVTAVCGCMADYGDGPTVWLLRRIAPAPSGQALLMGNFAGQLLDESLHSENRDKPYAESVRDFFRTSAVSIMALGDDFNSRKFHGDAHRQLQNIHAAVDRMLPSLVPFSPREAVVEPSFFCEALGLQGRMDCLTLDGTVVVEQKSGKGAFGSKDDVAPLLRREHYAQLLLYRAALRYGCPGKEAEAFLLYSGYAEPLVRAGRSETLTQEAMALRNRLALAEMDYADRGFGMLLTLTPAMLNTRRRSGRLWHAYQCPQLESELAPLGKADRVEQLYFLRMMRFVALEHRIAKTGVTPGDGTGFASTWQIPAAARRAAGNMLDGMRLVSPTAGHSGSVSSMELNIGDDRDNDAANFRPGDVVLLYSYLPGEAPDLRRALPLRCVMRDMSGTRLTLTLRTPQSDARVLLRDRDALWAMEHDFIESGTDAQLRGLHVLLRAPAERRRLLLGMRMPEVDSSVGICGDYGGFNPVVTAAMRARDIYLVVGPPGTGKTSHALMGILREELMDAGAAVLLTAYTNRAVDEICRNLHDGGIDFVRIGGDACPDFCRSHTVGAIVEAAAGIGDVRRRLETVRVVVGTVSAFNCNPALLRMRSFSLAIVDEASQILEPQLAAIFAAVDGRGRSAIGRFVLIGDHKQLPAVVRQSVSQSRIDEPELRAIGFDNCRTSLFERLYRKYAGHDEYCCMLTRQGRMHPDIAAFPSQAFYAGLLEPVPVAHQKQSSPQSRVRFVPVRGDGRGAGKVNQAEAEVIADIVVRLWREHGDAFDPAATVGVIVPYRNQISAVRAAIVARCGNGAATAVTVDTVERYQGSQREHIIYGTTVNDTAQLAFLCDSTMTDIDGCIVDRRLNVALTRAREYLTIVGNPDVLRTDPSYASLLRWLGV